MSNSLQLLVSIYTGPFKRTKTCDIKSDATESVESVKQKIQAKEGIPAERQRLMFGSKTMENGKTMADYDIKCESEHDTVNLHLVLTGLGGGLVNDNTDSELVQVLIKSLSGTTLTLDVHSHDSIQSVKQKIQAKAGIPYQFQRLIYGGTQLDNLRTLSYYHIDQDDMLYMLLDVRGGSGQFLF